MGRRHSGRWAIFHWIAIARSALRAARAVENAGGGTALDDYRDEESIVARTLKGIFGWAVRCCGGASGGGGGGAAAGTDSELVLQEALQEARVAEHAVDMKMRYSLSHSPVRGAGRSGRPARRQESDYLEWEGGGEGGEEEREYEPRLSLPAGRYSRSSLSVVVNDDAGSHGESFRRGVGVLGDGGRQSLEMETASGLHSIDRWARNSRGSGGGSGGCGGGSSSDGRRSPGNQEALGCDGGGGGGGRPYIGLEQVFHSQQPVEDGTGRNLGGSFSRRGQGSSQAVVEQAVAAFASRAAGDATIGGGDGGRNRHGQGVDSCGAGDETSSSGGGGGGGGDDHKLDEGGGSGGGKIGGRRSRGRDRVRRGGSPCHIDGGAVEPDKACSGGDGDDVTTVAAVATAAAAAAAGVVAPTAATAAATVGVVHTNGDLAQEE
jgi:hypothetical protein